MRDVKKNYQCPIIRIIEMRGQTLLQGSKLDDETLPFNPGDDTGEVLSKQTSRGFWDDEESE